MKSVFVLLIAVPLFVSPLFAQTPGDFDIEIAREPGDSPGAVNLPDMIITASLDIPDSSYEFLISPDRPYYMGDRIEADHWLFPAMVQATNPPMSVKAQHGPPGIRIQRPLPGEPNIFQRNPGWTATGIGTAIVGYLAYDHNRGSNRGNELGVFPSHSEKGPCDLSNATITVAEGGKFSCTGDHADQSSPGD